jgi:hypothetical protein
MTTWLGQLVIAKSAHPGKPAFKVQYWRTPSMTPAFIAFNTAEELHLYLRHCRLSGTTPDEIVAKLDTDPQLIISTLESEEAVS